MAALLLVLAVLLVSPACGGGGEDRAEIEALTVELGEMSAATIAAHDTLTANAVERSAAHVARAEARAVRGESLIVDVDTLTAGAALTDGSWNTRLNTRKTNHARVLTRIEDVMTRDEWDLHFPRETGAGLTPRGIVANLRDAALFNRDRLVGIVEREAAAP